MDPDGEFTHFEKNFIHQTESLMLIFYRIIHVIKVVEMNVNETERNDVIDTYQTC